MIFRPISVTFIQSFSLMPCSHMNVFENVAFPLRLHGVDKEIEKRVLEVLKKMVQLEGFEKRSIRKLSGDNVSVWPHCPCHYQPTTWRVLLDEPLSALDLKLRTDMQYELRGAATIGYYLCFYLPRSGRSPGYGGWILSWMIGWNWPVRCTVDAQPNQSLHFVAAFIGESNTSCQGTMIEAAHEKRTKTRCA